MSNATDYFEALVLNQWFRGVATTIPGTLYVSLLTADPTDTGSTANEVSGGSYARVGLASNTSNWVAPAANGATTRISNNVSITFASPTAAWGTVTNFGIHDALSGGNMLFYGVLSTARTVASGDNAPAFSTGSLTIDVG